MFRKPYFSKLNIDYLSYKGNDFNRFKYKNINKDGFVVQGVCITNEYYLISSYYKNKAGIKEKSRIYFYNKNTLLYDGYVVLDNSSHVGGICYDNLNDVIYITGSFGRVNAYRYSGFVKCLNDYDNVSKYKIDTKCLDISLNLDGSVSAATIYYFDKCLYVATCSEKGNLVRYEIDFIKDENKIVVRDVDVYDNLPACIQGLVVFKYLNNNYFLISQSYGKLKSCIKLYDFEKMQFLGQKIIGRNGLEGIDFTSLGNIYCIFENNDDSSKIIHISSIKNNISNRLENKYIEKGRLHQLKLNKLIEKK